MKYLIDSNVLITAHRITSPIDIYPSFWDKWKKITSNNYVFSLDKVKSEIYYQDDILSDWCKENITDNFWLSSASCMNEYANLQNWAQMQSYNNSALLEFAEFENADPFLLAYIMNQKEEDWKIVTLETSNPNSVKRIKLPDASQKFNVKCIDSNTFYRELGIIF